LSASDHYLLVFILFVVVLLASPPLLSYAYTPPESMVFSQKARRDGVTPPGMLPSGYGILVWVAAMPCAAIGGVFGMAFRIILDMKDIERGGSAGPKHAWGETIKMGKSQPEIWLKAGQFSILGALVFGGWAALWLWPVVR
jgi:hypothetical protein